MNVESIHEENVIDNDNKEAENNAEDDIVNNEPEIQKRNSNPIEDDNKKLKTVNEEITYEEKTDDIKVNTLNDNKETDQVIDEPIQEEAKEPIQNTEENPNPIEEEEKNDNNPQEEANNEDPTDPEIKERNKVVDTYLAELDNKDGPKKEEPVLSSNQDEPDEFEKADLEYRKKKEEEEQHNQEEEHYPNEEEQPPQIEEHQTEETPNNEQSNNQSPPNKENSKSISRKFRYKIIGKCI